MLPASFLRLYFRNYFSPVFPLVGFYVAIFVCLFFVFVYIDSIFELILILRLFAGLPVHVHSVVFFFAFSDILSLSISML